MMERIPELDAVLRVEIDDLVGSEELERFVGDAWINRTRLRGSSKSVVTAVVPHLARVYATDLRHGPPWAHARNARGP